MTPDERRMLADIEQNEQWLRDHVPPTPTPTSLEQLKLQVQMVVDETTLKRWATPPPSDACLARVRLAIRQELARPDSGTPRRRRISGRLVAGGITSMLAAAAAIAVLVTSGRFEAPVEDDPLADLIAAVEARQADAENDVALLRDELTQAEREFDGFVTDAGYESEIDDLSQDMDDLLDELSTYMEST
jgi:hypothetical protein